MEVPVGRAQHGAMKPNIVGRNASMILGLILATAPGLSKTPVTGVRVAVRVFDYGSLPAGARSEVASAATRSPLRFRRRAILYLTHVNVGWP